MSRWWDSEPGQIYWLEVTDRDDIGEDLHAPQLKEDGTRFSGYLFVREVKPGDVILHCDIGEKPSSIVGFSVVTSDKYWKAPTVWAARGKSAEGIEPYERPGYWKDLRDYTVFDQAVTLDDIRDREKEIESLKTAIKARHGADSLYFPFHIQSGALRTGQGYLFKLPNEFLQIFSSLKTEIDEKRGTPGQSAQKKVVETLEEESLGEEQGASGDPSGQEGQGFVGSAAYRKAIESHSMEAARKYFNSEEGYMLKDTSANSPYDFVGTKGEEQLYIEVKGTSGGAGRVFLTKNEVEHAQDARHDCALFVLYDISVEKEGEEIDTSGGKRELHWPWIPKEGGLTAITYKYDLGIERS